VRYHIHIVYMLHFHIIPVPENGHTSGTLVWPRRAAYKCIYVRIDVVRQKFTRLFHIMILTTALSTQFLRTEMQITVFMPKSTYDNTPLKAVANKLNILK
jgi:hypothetical protein